MSGVDGPDRATFPWVRTVLGYLVLLAVVALLALTVIVPGLSGGAAYTVLTGSMRPTLSPGTLIITQRVQASELMIGDVITFQLATDEPAVVTHRITAISYAADGGITFRTLGDNNGAADEKPVEAGQIRGRLWYAVPFVGYLNTWLNGHTRIAVIGVFGLGLLGYAGAMFVSAGRDRRRVAAGAVPRRPAQVSP